MERYAHISEDARTQTIEEHLRGAAKLAEDFAGRIGFAEWGRLLALLHDLAKYSDEFQAYIRGEPLSVGRDCEDDASCAAERGEVPSRGKVDHSTAGAQFIQRSACGAASVWKQRAAKILALIIAGHHGGLPDTLSADGEDLFLKRMAKNDARTHLSEALKYAPESILNEAREILSDEDLYKRLKTYMAGIKEAESAVCAENLRDRYEFALGMLIKMLYSCLVDADRCDTADFCAEEAASIRQRSRYADWGTLAARLEEHLQKFETGTPLARIRREISDWSKEAGARPRGIFTMTVPTGGGKTLASLRFALEHAKLSMSEEHPIERIIYVIPYTTIIDQNARRVREILEKDENERGRIVLECHSNLLEESDTPTNRILSENWDAPVVFTTNVQFLETIFSRSPNRARRMHQLANSVIIFDEIQTLPIKTVHLFCSAVNFLVEKCGTSVLLCTATQPLLNGVEKKYGALNYGRDAEITPEPEKLFDSLKRVKIYSRMKPGGYSTKELADMAREKQREFGTLLVIVNTTSTARKLYEELSVHTSGAAVFHMSARMCPAHRMDVLDRISRALAAREPLICVATSVMEAGVDADFSCVIRSVAGFDSIVQAAGRCNREGLAKAGFVYIVNPSDENLSMIADVREGRNCAERVIDEARSGCVSEEEDILSLANIERYFKYYFYARQDEMRYRVKDERSDTLLNMLSCNRLTHGGPQTLRQAFATAGRLFEAIDAPTEGVLVPYGDGADIIATIGLCGSIGDAKKLLRRAQRYSVNIYPYQLNALYESGGIYKIEIGRDSGVWALLPEFYNENFGVSTECTGKAGLYMM